MTIPFLERGILFGKTRKFKSICLRNVINYALLNVFIKMECPLRPSHIVTMWQMMKNQSRDKHGKHRHVVGLFSLK